MAATKSKRKFTFPTAFTILFILLFLIALATWIIPSGSYDYDADGAPIPGSYHPVPANPQKLLQSALPQIAVRRARAFTQSGQPFLRHVNARMFAAQFRPQR